MKERRYAGIVINNYGEIIGCLSDKEIISYYPISNTYNGYCSRGAGGIAVNNYKNAKIVNCYYNGTISLGFTSSFTNQSTYVGGVAGRNQGNIEACYTDGDVDVSEAASKGGRLNLYVGGITGYGGTVINCYSMQDIDAFGRCDSTTDSNCYASGIGNASAIENCYFSGALKMTSYTCNVYLAGIGYANTITNSYYESDSPFSDDAEHGTPLSATMLKLQESFNGWNFDTVWAIDPEINDGYPYLQWEYEKDTVDVTTVTVDKSELSLNVGETDVITATVLPDDATNKNVVWTSSDTSVIIVADGTVTAVGTGSATITVTTEDGNHKALCSVVVTETTTPEEPVVLDYTVDYIKINNGTGEELESIPNGGFYAEISITKNTDREAMDKLIIAAYDENDNLIELTYMSGSYVKEQNISFGALIKSDGVKTLKAFVWNDLLNMEALSNVCEYK